MITIVTFNSLSPPWSIASLDANFSAVQSAFGSVGALSLNTTAVGNVGVGEDTLMSYSLPASTLNAAGKGVRVWAKGLTANNANAKTLKFKIASTNIINLSLTVSQASRWWTVIDICRTGTDAQSSFRTLLESVAGSLSAGKMSIEEVATTETESGVIVLSFTGEATADNDIVQSYMRVERLGLIS